MSGFVLGSNGGGGGGDAEMKVAHALANPGLFASQLSEMEKEQMRARMLEIPAAVQRRIRAVKKLQLASLELEAEFYREVHSLEAVYQAKFAALADRRKDIVVGAAEPSDADADFPLIGGVGGLEKELETKATLAKDAAAAQPPDAQVPAGIPEFWLASLKNTELLGEMIEEADEGALAHLQDIELRLSAEGQPLGFDILFHFSPNDWFTNDTLTKAYRLKCEVDPEDPFEFDGPEIVSCTATKIDWKSKEKNLTVKQVKKKQKNKKQGNTRWVTKEVKADSFFNFFDPPAHDENTDLDELDDETRELLSADFEIGQVLRDRIVPRAVLYFTGEAQDDDDYEDEDEEEDEDDDEDEDEDEDDDDAPPTGKNKADHK